MSGSISQPPYRCKLCTFKSYTTGILRAHCKVFHHGLKVITNTKFPSRPGNIKNAKQTSSMRRFDCPYCKYKCAKQGNLKQHIISSHFTAKKIKCRRCGKDFSSIYKLRCHIASHGVKQFKCEFCSYTAALVTTLNQHIREVHQGFKRFRCNLCNTQFMRASHLQQHRETVHSSETFKCTIVANNIHVSKH